MGMKKGPSSTSLGLAKFRNFGPYSRPPPPPPPSADVGPASPVDGNLSSLVQQESTLVVSGEVMEEEAFPDLGVDVGVVRMEVEVLSEKVRGGSEDPKSLNAVGETGQGGCSMEELPGNSHQEETPTDYGKKPLEGRPAVGLSVAPENSQGVEKVSVVSNGNNSPVDAGGSGECSMLDKPIISQILLNQFVGALIFDLLREMMGPKEDSFVGSFGAFSKGCGFCRDLRSSVLVREVSAVRFIVVLPIPCQVAVNQLLSLG